MTLGAHAHRATEMVLMSGQHNANEKSRERDRKHTYGPASRTILSSLRSVVTIDYLTFISYGVCYKPITCHVSGEYDTHHAEERGQFCNGHCAIELQVAADGGQKRLLANFVEEQLELQAVRLHVVVYGRLCIVVGSDRAEELRASVLKKFLEGALLTARGIRAKDMTTAGMEEYKTRDENRRSRDTRALLQTAYW